VDKLPTPYYQSDGITIYCGDCRDVLPHLPCVDLVLTDPPYGIGEADGKNKSRSCIAVSRDYGNNTWDNKPISADLMKVVIATGHKAIVFGGNYYNMPSSSCWLVWDKDNGDNDFADCELAWTNLSCAVRRIRHRWQGMLQEHGGRGKEVRQHPTQKPVPVMLWALQIARMAPPATVLDPFMGSGTTLVAAKRLGLRAIGIEIEEKYCEIAKRRLAQKVLGFDA